MNREIGVYVGNEHTSDKPIVFNIFERNRKQRNYNYGISGEGRCFYVNQSLEGINELYPRHCRSVEHIFKSNNWLKLHGMKMRRKPFKKEYIVLDEFHMMFHK